jgi:hypothetical protein
MLKNIPNGCLNVTDALAQFNSPKCGAMVRVDAG